MWKLGDYFKYSFSRLKDNQSREPLNSGTININHMDESEWGLQLGNLPLEDSFTSDFEMSEPIDEYENVVFGISRCAQSIQNVIFSLQTSF